MIAHCLSLSCSTEPDYNRRNFYGGIHENERSKFSSAGFFQD